MVAVIRTVYILAIILVLALAGYWGVATLLPGTLAGEEVALWVVAFCYGALVVSLGWYLFQNFGVRPPADAAASKERAELGELCEEISNLSEASTLYFLLSQRLASILRWKRAALFALDEAHNRYVCNRSCGEYDTPGIEKLVLKRTEPFFQDFLEQRARFRRTLIEADEVGDDSSPLHQAMMAHGMRHLLPLVNRGRLIAFILSASRRPADAMTEEMLRAVAFHSAAAFDAILLTEHEAIDRLTGFMRGGLFESRIDEEIRRSRRSKNPFSLLIIDIDELREINEKHGDEAGNEVILSISRTIRDKLRKSDLACRSGGEEFMVLLPDTDSEKASFVADNLRSQIEKLVTKVEDSGLRLKRTVSIGIATQHPDVPSFFDELIQQAQKALLQAKTHGKNTVAVYTDTMPL